MNVPVAQVGQIIGGKVGQNVASGVFQNACPIRMSYIFNFAGVLITSAGYHVVSGADHRWYIYRVGEMMSFLERTFGKPDVTTRMPKTADFSGQRGLLVVNGVGWNNAAGHVTLWDGWGCSDYSHLTADPDNGTFTPQTASLWRLP